MMNLARFQHYKIGVLEIDNEHWEICEMLNEAFALAKAGNFEGLVGLVERINEKLKARFDSEDRAMEKSGYPWLKALQDDHKKLITSIDSFLLKTRDTRYASTFFASDLEKLLLDHIDYQDRQYEEFLKK